MDDQRRPRPDDTPPTEPGEGVRIIGADEAAEAMERGDVAARRGDDQQRFGDRPAAPPVGPRPSLRFPLDASADPTRIERPPVQPAPEPVTGPVDMPHWTEPPTGEVPAVLIGDDSPFLEDGEDLDAWSSFATSTPRWRDADDDWDDGGFVEQLATDSGQVRMGALGEAGGEDQRVGFDDLEERVEERRSEAAEPVARASDDDWSASVGEIDDEGPGQGWSDEDWIDDASDDAGYGTEPEPRAVATSPAPGPVAPPVTPGGGDRDLGSAVAVGAGLRLVAVILLLAFRTGMVVLGAARLGTIRLIDNVELRRESCAKE